MFILLPVAEIVKLSEEIEKGARSGIKREDCRKIDSFIEVKILEAQMKKMKKVCEYGEERDWELNGLRNRQVKILNNDLQLKVPRFYYHDTISTVRWVKDYCRRVVT